MDPGEGTLPESDRELFHVEQHERPDPFHVKRIPVTLTQATLIHVKRLST